MKARRVFLHTDDGRGVVIRPDNHLHLTTDRAHWTPLVIRMPDGKFDVGHFAEFERGDVENGSPIATLRTYPPYDAVEPNVILATPSCVMRLRISRGLEFGTGWAFGDVDGNGPYYLSAAHEEDAPLMMRKNDDGTPQHQRNWFLTDTATGQEIDQPF